MNGPRSRPLARVALYLVGALLAAQIPAQLTARTPPVEGLRAE